ncbi:two-component response regulator-like APRR5 [Rutidosis leptorrhynchoides]|uniref:two-component response regulator-like APRR5 n=1 Tax=Rutidosis leptorrhynchoides TaxID=125765 RepID=UPI003A99E9FB
MGEMALSSREQEQLVKTTVEENRKDDGGGGGGDDGGGGGRGGTVKWESLFSRKFLRVLLVEADDSTRQIIAALLRKCNYRVVAVTDGLKAWELLKGKPHNIDLILTEGDLPAISGFALLTLIMEHEICKNIPVIMMSSEDSISTVYKCMLRGAADYLVKPIRRNELRNLWQHVWRRRSLSFAGSAPQDESIGQQKVEATAENNAASDRASGSMDCIQRNNDCLEKGSDAQSSCTKPDMETESAPMETTQDLSETTWGKSSRNETNLQNCEANASFHEGFAVGFSTEVNRATSEPKVQRRDNFTANEEASDVNSTKTAIDFMGTSNNHVASNDGMDKFDFSPSLDLSLRRSTLTPSDSSAFTRYTNRSLLPQHPTLVGSDFDQLKASGSNSDKNYSQFVTGYKSDVPDPLLSSQSVVSFVTGHSGVATSCPQQKVLPVQVKGVRVNDGYGSVHPIFCTQSNPSPTPTPSQLWPSIRKNTFYQNNYENSELLYNQLGQNTDNLTQKQDHVMDCVDRGHISPTTDQSTSGSFCNGAISRFNSIGAYGSTCGSNGNTTDQVAVGNSTVAESKNEDGYFSTNGNSHRSIQREAALNKFRLKRKDRCFEKKVRYESRKKLAEQRPRIKGQFVRQVQSDAPHVENGNN